MKILLVEDSQRLQRSISTGLRTVGHAVDQAFDGQQALEYAHQYGYDVIVLDLMLPKLEGLTVLSTLRRERNSACVLILSAKDQTEDRIRGLDLGADDYLVKPFSFDELLSRIRALFRRRANGSSPNIEIDPLRIDTLARRLYCNGWTLSLTPTEFVLIEYLARYRGRVFSHQQLIDQVYEAAAEVSKNAVEAHISSIRKKLKDAGAPPMIKTRRGFGYLIE